MRPLSIRAFGHTAAVATATVGERARAVSWTRAATLGALAALLVGAASSAVPAASAGSVIHACYNGRSGALRIVPRGRCRGGETPISWNLAGRKGARGPAGPAGFLGVQGATGAAGASAGPEAPRGPEGAVGRPGLAGAEGASPVGATGSSSVITGGTGPAGATGAGGPPGAEGARGPTGAGGGATGATGATGAAGGPLPAVLEPGHSETGAWIVTDSGREPQLPPKYASGEISFPIPLKEKLGEFAVHFVNREEEELNEKEGAKIPPEQPEKGIVGGECTTEKHTELVEHPVAEPGNLCAYAGFEELLPAGDAAFFDLVTARGTAGADLGGSNIVFEFNEQTAAGAKKGHIRVQGSWAVAE